MIKMGIVKNSQLTGQSYNWSEKGKLLRTNDSQWLDRYSHCLTPAPQAMLKIKYEVSKDWNKVCIVTAS